VWRRCRPLPWTMAVCRPAWRLARSRHLGGHALNDCEDPCSLGSGIVVIGVYEKAVFAPTVSRLGAALGGGGGAFWSTSMYIPRVQAVAAVQPARMSEG
jgi:hypothetical protein